MIAARAVSITAALYLGTLLAPYSARADEIPSGPAPRISGAFDDRFRLTIGATAATTQTDLRVDANNDTPGTEVSGEDDLGLREKSTLADVEAELRLRKRHRVRFNYFALGRDAQRTLTRQVRFGDDIYNITDNVQSQFDIRDFSTTYSYAFVRTDRLDIAGSFTVHLFEFDAQARVPARGIEEEEAETGPLPALGLQAGFRLSDRWYVEARGEYLSRRVDDIEGKFKNLKAAVLYRFNRNLAVGAGYSSLTIDVISHDAGDSGRFTLGNSGGQLFVRLGF